ncbi:MAG: cysteine-rich CWC family protein [Ferruginibacter sp.]
MHENKNCPGCGISFECKVGNITQCQCYGINLSNDEQQFISKQFTDCLCSGCINALRAKYNISRFTTLIKKHPGH